MQSFGKSHLHWANKVSVIRTINISCVLFLILPVIVVGCKKPSGTVAVHGKASYRGEALKSARVTFFPSNGQPISTVITDGEYEAELPAGDYTVAINIGSELPPGFKEGDPLPPPPKIVLPETYSTRAKSTLKVNVKPDQNEAIDFDLK